MVGQFLALLTGLGFGAASVFIRQAVFRTRDTFSVLFVSILVGVVIFGLMILASGEASQLASASWKALAALAGTGIVGFTMGRWLSYYSLQLIGANRATPLLNSSIFVSVTLGITLMDEPFTPGLMAGVVFIVIGVVLISTERGSDSTPEDVRGTADLVKGVAAGLSAGICYGCGPVLAKIAIEDEGTSPYVAVFVAHSVAAIAMLVPYLRAGEGNRLSRLYSLAAFPMAIGALATVVAQLCRYLSLDLIPVSVVIPLNSTNALFTIPLSWAVNRRIEIFSWRVIGGALSEVVGVFLIFQLD